MTASAPSAAVQPTQPGEHRPAQVLAEETASLETAVEERTARETAAPEAASREAAGILSLLDGEQRAAAERTRGPLVIIAGPGTGKTRTLTHRIAHIIERCGALPEECLAITFTRRAAGEMRERLIRLLGEAAARIPVLTIHSLGLEILEEHGERLGLRKPLRVAGESERRDLLREALGVGEREARRRMARISLAKREGAVDEIAGDGVETGDPERHLRDDEGDPESCEAGGLEQDHELRGGGALDVRAGGDLASDLAMYDAALRARGWLDFDDLIDLSGKLLEEHSDLAGLYRSRYRWVSVDEVQDIDASQYRLIRLLVAPDGNLCGIGDPDQSIYGFRGADAGCLRRIEADFPATRILHLTTNYRSSRPIVEGALQVIAPSSLVEGRRLEARSGGGAPIEVVECATERAEAESVVHAIERMIGGSTFFSMDSERVAAHEGESLAFGDFAVLYRTDAQAAALIEALHRSGMPFQKRSHRPLAEVPAVRSVMRILEERDAGERGGDRPVRRRLDEAIARVREADGSIDMHRTALQSLAEMHPDDLPRLLSELALGVDADLWDERAEAVSLLTLHAAKGLEFPVVFITGCEDGVLPLRREGEAVDLAEERRLFFVGMTRARQRLILTRARRRAWRGPAREMPPSPFLDAIEEKRFVSRRTARRSHPRPEFQQLTLFGDG